MSVRRYILSVLFLVVLLQMMVTAVVIWQNSRNVIVDTFHSYEGIFRYELSMAVYATPLIVQASDQPQMIILGSSNTQLWLRAEELQPLLGSAIRVHSIAFPRQNVDTIGQLIDLIYRQSTAQQRANYTFVVGINAGMFANNPKHLRNGKTEVEEELLRYGIFYDSPNGIAPRIPQSWLSAALQMTWPFAMLRKSIDMTICMLLPERFWFGVAKPWHSMGSESNTDISNLQRHAAMIHYMKEYMGPVNENTNGAFEKFLAIAERVNAVGGHMVIVDLPTAQWLKNAVPMFADYEQRVKPYIARLEKLRNVRYVNMQHGFEDDDFYDGTHPRAKLTPAMANRAVLAIHQALGK